MARGEGTFTLSSHQCRGRVAKGRLSPFKDVLEWRVALAGARHSNVLEWRVAQGLTIQGRPRMVSGSCRGGSPFKDVLEWRVALRGSPFKDVLEWRVALAGARLQGRTPSGRENVYFGTVGV